MTPAGVLQRNEWSRIVAEVERRDVTPSFFYVGRVEAVETVELVARVEGFLEQRDFREGGHVEKGDLLFLMRRRPWSRQAVRAPAGVPEAPGAHGAFSLGGGSGPERFRHSRESASMRLARKPEASVQPAKVSRIVSRRIPQSPGKWRVKWRMR